LEKITRTDRQRYWVREYRGGGFRDFRQILLLPRDQTTRQHLAVLCRLSQSNPNFPMILEQYARGEEIFLVTTWIRGEDLESYLRRTQSNRQPKQWPSPYEMFKLYRGLAHGLSQLHRHCRVVHGDIRPANLIFTRASNRLVMIDYGSAWMMENTVHKAVGDGFSEFYAAPEQQREHPLADFRSDQFSAAVVVYQMFTGKLPYGGLGGKAGRSEFRSKYEPLYEAPSKTCPLRLAVPKRIWAFIDEALAKSLSLDPAERFQKRSEWIDALDDIHCEMRRKAHFTTWEKIVIRFCERFLLK
jgi:serine/threonine protein kinase